MGDCHGPGDAVWSPGDADWGALHRPGCQCGQCAEFSRNTTRTAKRTKTMRGCSGTDVPTHISLRELYGEEGLRSLDDADVKVSDLPTYGEGSRDDVMQDAPHQGQGEAPRPGATECGQSPMETDNTHDHDTHMFDDETDARGSSPGARVPRQSGARQSGPRRHHAVSEPGSAILDIYALTAEEIIEKAQAHLSRKGRRKQQRRCKLDAAQQKERTRAHRTELAPTLRAGPRHAAQRGYFQFNRCFWKCNSVH